MATAKAAAAYTSHLRAFLQHEFSAEVSAVKERLRSWPRHKLQREGISLFDLLPREMGTFHGYQVVRLYPAYEQVLPYHRLVFGDTVTLSRDNPLSTSAGQGVVLNRTDKWINVAVRRMPQGRQALIPDGALPEGGKMPTVRVDQGWNDVVHERMECALRTIASKERERTRPSWLLPLLVEHSLASLEASLGQSQSVAPDGSAAHARRRRVTSAAAAAADALADDETLSVAHAPDQRLLDQQLQQALNTFRRPVLPRGGVPMLDGLVEDYWAHRAKRTKARSELDASLRDLARKHGAKVHGAGAAGSWEAMPSEGEALQLQASAASVPDATRGTLPSGSNGADPLLTSNDGDADPDLDSPLLGSTDAALDLTPEMEAERVISVGLQVARLQRAWAKREATGGYRDVRNDQEAKAAAALDASSATDGPTWFTPTGLSTWANPNNLPESLRKEGWARSRGASPHGGDSNDGWGSYDDPWLLGDDAVEDMLYADKRKRTRVRGPQGRNDGRSGEADGARPSESLEPEVLTFSCPSASSLSGADLQAVLSSLDHLNASQRAAIVVGLTSKVTCLQGPPGTGKTKTAAHMVKAWREVQRRRAAALPPASANATGRGSKFGGSSSGRPSFRSTSTLDPDTASYFPARGGDDAVDAAVAEVDAIHLPRVQPGGPVLAAASSNTAVDQLLENFLAQGLNAVRVGDVVRVRPELRSASVEAAVAAHPAMEVVKKLLAEAEELTVRLARVTGNSGDKAGSSGGGKGASLVDSAPGIITSAPAAKPKWNSAIRLATARYSVLATPRASVLLPSGAAARPVRAVTAALGPAGGSSPPSAFVPAAVPCASLSGGHQLARYGSAAAMSSEPPQRQNLRRSQTSNLISTFRGYARGLKRSELTVGQLKLMRAGIGEMLARASRIERELAIRVIREADVVCATATGAGHELLRGLGVNFLIVDEASQIREPELLIPLCRLGSEESQLVLIGDDRQLPPVVHSPRSLPLRVSLFERLLKTALPGEPTGHGSMALLGDGTSAGSDGSDLEAAVAARRAQLTERIRAAEVRALAYAYGSAQASSAAADDATSPSSSAVAAGSGSGAISQELLEVLGLAKPQPQGDAASGAQRVNTVDVDRLEAFFQPEWKRVENVPGTVSGPSSGSKGKGVKDERPAGEPSLDSAPLGLQQEVDADALPSVDTLRCVPVARCMLTLGYRMHPAIAAWPNWALYASRIRDAHAHARAARLLGEQGSPSAEGTDAPAVPAAHRRPPPGFPWPYDLPLAFVPVTDGKEASSEDTKSKMNVQEAATVAQIVRALLKWRPTREPLQPASATDGDADGEIAVEGDASTAAVDDELGRLKLRRPLHASDIGIVAPYAAQVRLISEGLRKEGFTVVEGTGHARGDDEDDGLSDDDEEEGNEGASEGDSKRSGASSEADAPASESSDSEEGTSSDTAAGVTKPLPAAARAVRKASKARAQAYADNVEHGRDIAESTATGASVPMSGAAQPSEQESEHIGRHKAAAAARKGRSNVIEVRSVDGYQGREKQVMIMSATRSNDSGSVGFLADYRRLNVALTRARSGLIVVGDHRTLAHDECWESWLRFVTENDLVVPRATLPRR